MKIINTKIRLVSVLLWYSMIGLDGKKLLEKMAVKDKEEEADVIRETLHTPRQDWHLWKERGKEEGLGERDSHCSRNVRMSRRGCWGVLKPVTFYASLWTKEKWAWTCIPPTMYGHYWEKPGGTYTVVYSEENHLGPLSAIFPAAGELSIPVFPVPHELPLG